jgi:GT2 family glycosyltransferase
VESVRAQGIPAEIFVIDNGSDDGTREWAALNGLLFHGFVNNEGVSKGWNFGLERFFSENISNAGSHHCLVIGNDTVLAPWAYSALLSANVPFVTGVDVGMDPLPAKPDVFPLSPHPDFSCFLIRRECWEKVGPFDERLVHYCSDCDLHVRAHRLGIPLYKASVPYNHERSSTMKRASAEDALAIREQANKDREVFQLIYGCLPGTKEYEEMFK